MYNQRPSIGRIDPINIVSGPPIDQNASEKSGMRQFHPPPYQEYLPYPNVRYLPPGSYPGPYGYPVQHYRTPGAPQAPYSQEPYPSAFHQGQLPGHPGITVQPTVFMTPTPVTNPKPDYMCYSVFTLLCCCLPLGVAALVYSASVSVCVCKYSTLSEVTEYVILRVIITFICLNRELF